MNCLNQIIIEGTVGSRGEKKENVFSFDLLTVRTYADGNGGTISEESVFCVRSFNSLAEYSEKYAELDRGVRIVGRVKMESWKDASGRKLSKAVIVAEHMEFKPLTAGKN